MRDMATDPLTKRKLPCQEPDCKDGLLCSYVTYRTVRREPELPPKPEQKNQQNRHCVRVSAEFMKASDFDYELPTELIAQYPPRERTASRMLVMSRRTGQCRITPFDRFPDYVSPGDCVVLNNTKVIPARLFGCRHPSGGHVEVLLLEQVRGSRWRAMLRPGRRLRPGSEVVFDWPEHLWLTVADKNEENGTFLIDFNRPDVQDLAERFGHTPLPPYIEREDEEQDKVRYQTVYARHSGAVAAPTAGLHFNDETLERLRRKNVRIAEITLHAGPGTFRPVQTENIEQHRMHEEPYILPQSAADTINRTRQQGGRVLAVGTTVVRVLETCARSDRTVEPGEGSTDLFLHPPMQPQVPDVLLTNFHLPRSTLLMLVSTFSTRENVLEAYKLAVHHRMRFYSYGDCMLLV